MKIRLSMPSTTSMAISVTIAAQPSGVVRKAKWVAMKSMGSSEQFEQAHVLARSDAGIMQGNAGPGRATPRVPGRHQASLKTSSRDFRIEGSTATARAAAATRSRPRDNGEVTKVSGLPSEMISA